MCDCASGNISVAHSREHPYDLLDLSRFDGQGAVVVIDIGIAVVFSHLIVRDDLIAKQPVYRRLVRPNYGVRLYCITSGDGRTGALGNAGDHDTSVHARMFLCGTGCGRPGWILCDARSRRLSLRSQRRAILKQCAGCNRRSHRRPDGGHGSRAKSPRNLRTPDEHDHQRAIVGAPMFPAGTGSGAFSALRRVPGHCTVQKTALW